MVTLTVGLGLRGEERNELRAFDARTGKQLWSCPAPAGVIGVPTSFEVDGDQNVAVTAGWGLDAQGTQNGIDKAGTLLVFSLRYSMDARRSGATHEERFRTQSGSNFATHLTA